MSSGEELHRLRLTIHYDGSAFHGWQVQAEERTVQGDLEEAVQRLTGAHRTVLGSGRTDRGVHGLGQVASVDVPRRWSGREFRKAMNAVLPHDVWLASADPAAPDFHPRYDATSRTYLYRVGLADRARSPFVRPWCWALVRELDRSLLEAAAALLPGERSFRAFAKAGQPERGHRCTVHAARWTDWGEVGVTFTISANRYLHRMVRYLVGTMVDVARGRRPLEEMKALLEGTDDGLQTSPPAPPEGLYLARVDYDPDPDLADIHADPDFRFP